MKIRYTPVAIVLFSLLVLAGCKKDDPAPLEAEVRGKLLAGEKDASKNWSLIRITRSSSSSPAVTLNLSGCFLDNVLTFSNNASQDYQASEGADNCGGFPNIIEKGNWAFTLDGLVINILVDETFSSNGLFSSEILADPDPNGDGNTDDSYAFTIGYPYPASVVSLTETGMTLELNQTVVSSKIKYTMVFTSN